LLRSLAVRTAEVGPQGRGRALDAGGVCGKRGTGRRREARRIQRRPGDAMLGVAIASPRPLHMSEVSVRTRWGPVIEQLVEPGQRESAPQHAEQPRSGTASDEPLLHGFMIPPTDVLGPERLTMAKRDVRRRSRIAVVDRFRRAGSGARGLNVESGRNALARRRRRCRKSTHQALRSHSRQEMRRPNGRVHRTSSLAALRGGWPRRPAANSAEKWNRQSVLPALDAQTVRPDRRYWL
jgi:hypothetical protein